MFTGECVCRTSAGLLLYMLTGAAWLDPVAGFVIAAFALWEGKEAWEGELVEDDEDHEENTVSEEETA